MTDNKEVSLGEKSKSSTLRRREWSKGYAYFLRLLSFLGLTKGAKIKRIKQKRDLLLNQVTHTLDNEPQANVSHQLAQLANMTQILEMQSSWKRSTFMTILFLASVSLFLYFLPGPASPGYVEVNAKVVEITLAEDFEWADSIETSINEPIVLSHFSEVNSPDPPELFMPLSKGIFKVEAAGKIRMESLFIPKGAKIWLEWDGLANTLEFVISAGASTSLAERLVRAEFKLAGKSKYSVIGGEFKEREAIACPFSTQCHIARTLVVTSPLKKMPRIKFMTTGAVDLAGMEPVNFSFSKYELDGRNKKRSRCNLVSGEFKLRGDAQTYNIRNGECISIKSKTGSLGMELNVDNNQRDIQSDFKVWYHGELDSVKVGTPEFAQEKAPKLLSWILSHPLFHIFGSLGSAVIAIITILIGKKK